jgi:hypothetical protein
MGSGGRNAGRGMGGAAGHEREVRDAEQDDVVEAVYEHRDREGAGALPDGTEDDADREDRGRREDDAPGPAREVEPWIEANSRLASPTVPTGPKARPSRVWIAPRNSSSSAGATSTTKGTPRTSRTIGSATTYGSSTLLTVSTPSSPPSRPGPTATARAATRPPATHRSSSRVGTRNGTASRPGRHTTVARPTARSAPTGPEVDVWVELAHDRAPSGGSGVRVLLRALRA